MRPLRGRAARDQPPKLKGEHVIYLVLGFLREKLLPRMAPLKCYNCGATVDSRAPACSSCGMKFG